MKRIAIIIAALAMCFAANAQSYNWGIGVRGRSHGGDISVKHYLSADNAIDLYGDFSFNGWGWAIGGDYQFCYPTNVDGLEFYVGPGASIGAFSNSVSLSVEGVAGAEYCFAKIPLSLFVDYKPKITASLSGDDGGLRIGIGYLDLGLGARFYF